MRKAKFPGMSGTDIMIKAHKDNTPQFGLLAEDVAAVNANLVIYNTVGKTVGRGL